VAAVLAWCYEREVPIVPRGGGTGAAAGAVPDGGVVLALDRLDRVRSFDPELWRIHVEAGVPTGRLKQLVRESGLMFAPDPGAPEQSQIGGNIATNAGGPHAFKYGVVGDWVTGLEAALPPGELVSVGGPIRKDVAGYDLKRLLVGSEGTLGIVTAAWLKLLPAPESVLPVAVFHAGSAEGCAALLRVVGSGVVAAALDVLDAETLACGAASFPGGVPDGAGFVLLAEADGSRAEAERVRAELVDAAGEGAVGIHAPDDREGVDAFWRWRSGLAFAVLARRGGVVAEDIVVPLDRVEEAMDETLAIGRRHDSGSPSHAGDGNSTGLPRRWMTLTSCRAALAVRSLRRSRSPGGSRASTGWPLKRPAGEAVVAACLDLHGEIKLTSSEELLNPARSSPVPARRELTRPCSRCWSL
jgi:FAD/FMN-containing dehydrogenase